MIHMARIYNKQGAPMCELPPVIISRDWTLNDVGSAKFYINPEGMAEYLETGNYLVVTSDYLPPWVGRITTPRSWGSGVIEVNAKSIMQIFDDRSGPEVYGVNGSYGTVLVQIINYCNGEEDTLIRPGEIYSGGQVYSAKVDITNVLTYLNRSLSQAQMRLDFQPVLTDTGYLRILANLEPSFYTVTDLSLTEDNTKPESTILIEQGDVKNDIRVDATSIVAGKPRITARVRDENSRSRYGLRQYYVCNGATQAEVNRIAMNTLAYMKQPRRSLSLTVLNVNEVFKKIFMGATGHVNLRTVGYKGSAIGFEGDTYITGMIYSGSADEIQLVTAEIVYG